MKTLHNKIDRRILKKKLEESQEPRTTISFYQYANIGNPQIFRDYLYQQLATCGTFGRIYVAKEGVNGQISVPTVNLDQLRHALDNIEFLKGIRLNIAIDDDGKSFYKLIIKVKSKIVADGLHDDQFDVTNKGKHLSAEEYNELTSKDDTVIVDMRNHYEHEVGHFQNAILPDVETFRESLPLIADMLDDNKNKNIVMYCTGGIRCEKASAYMKHKGFKNVHQLEGGIIEYTRQVKKKGIENKFVGKNFVFDDRLGERITEDIIAKCHQCGVACDDHTNCANDACHILFIQCNECAAKYDNCCSNKCKEFNELSEEMRDKLKGQIEFNGTKFGKGRYKAHHKDETLTEELIMSEVVQGELIR